MARINYAAKDYPKGEDLLISSRLSHHSGSTPWHMCTSCTLILDGERCERVNSEL